MLSFPSSWTVTTSFLLWHQTSLTVDSSMAILTLTKLQWMLDLGYTIWPPDMSVGGLINSLVHVRHFMIHRSKALWMQSSLIKYYHLQTPLLSFRNTAWEKRCLLWNHFFSWFSSATTGRKMQYFNEKYYHIAGFWGISRRNTTKMLCFKGIQTKILIYWIYSTQLIWVVYSVFLLLL